MATITVNVKDETMVKFRQTVEHDLGIGKGKLGAAVDEALNRWVTEKEQQEIAERQMKLMAKGFDMGKFKKFNRDELYDRSI